MARFTTYKNSKLATFFSILGSIMIIGGVYALFNEEPVAGIIVAVLGIGSKVLGGYISQRKSKKDAEIGIKS